MDTILHAYSIYDTTTHKNNKWSLSPREQESVGGGVQPLVPAKCCFSYDAISPVHRIVDNKKSKHYNNKQRTHTLFYIHTYIPLSLLPSVDWTHSIKSRLHSLCVLGSIPGLHINSDYTYSWYIHTRYHIWPIIYTYFEVYKHMYSYVHDRSFCAPGE